MSSILSFSMGMFLYFPEDKSEYLPAVLTMLVFFLMAVLTMRVIILYNRREEKRAKEFEESLKKNKDAH